MISGGIDRVAQSNNAYVYLDWTLSPDRAVVEYIISYYMAIDPGRVYTTSSVTSSIKIGALNPNTSYFFAIQAKDRSGTLSAISAYNQYTTPIDTVAPMVPTGLVATMSNRGALVSCNANDPIVDGDIQGYQFRVSVGAGPLTVVNSAPQLGTYLNYQAPSGTLPGTPLTFQVRAVDWSGNWSAWSASATPVTTDGTLFDELLTGNITALGTITSGGFQAGTPDRPHLVMDSTGLTLYDGTNFDYGYGPGVTVRLDSGSGAGFFSGTLASRSLLTGGIQSAAAANIPDIPANFSGFQLDALYGMRFYKVGVLQAQFGTTGQIDIVSGASINLFGGSISGGTITGTTINAAVLQSTPGSSPSAKFDLTGTPNIVFKDTNGIARLTLGQYTSVVDSSQQYGLQGLDASGGLRFDTFGQHNWTSAVDQWLNRPVLRAIYSGASGVDIAGMGTIAVDTTAGFTGAGTLLYQLGSGQFTVITYLTKDATHFYSCTGGSGTTLLSDWITQGYTNGKARRLAIVSLNCQLASGAGVAYFRAISTITGALQPAGQAGFLSDSITAASINTIFSVTVAIDPGGLYGVMPITNGGGSIAYAGNGFMELDF